VTNVPVAVSLPVTVPCQYLCVCVCGLSMCLQLWLCVFLCTYDVLLGNEIQRPVLRIEKLPRLHLLLCRYVLWRRIVRLCVACDTHQPSISLSTSLMGFTHTLSLSLILADGTHSTQTHTLSLSLSLFLSLTCLFSLPPSYSYTTFSRTL
jgi:hypothetical protein